MDDTAVLMSNGIINLGYHNPSSVKRLANWAQNIINTGAPVPRSPFCIWAAGRVTDDQDKQNLKLLISGRTGSGKSYSALYLAIRLSEEIAMIMGDEPSDHFDLERNCALLTDTKKVAKMLAISKKYQVMLIDDAGVTSNAKEFLKASSISLHKIVMTMRTKRGIVIFTSPLKKNIDLGIREVADITMRIFKGFHKGGFNILKATSLEVSEQQKNKIYERRLSFFNRKIDFWVAFAPPKELTEKYDFLRDIAAQQLLEETAGMRKEAPKEKEEDSDYVTKAERNLERLVKKYGEKIKADLANNPGVSINSLAAKHRLTLQNVRRIMVGVGLPYPERKKKVQ